MPKERFHLYLADELSIRCKKGLSGINPAGFTHARPPASRRPAAPESPRHFFIGAVSPDIFFYDLPSFSLSPLGDALHDLLDRKGISVIYDWVAQPSPGSKGVYHAMTDWAMGFACHFLADAIWHPVIDELSRAHLNPAYGGGKDLSEIQCHRLIESEIESQRLAGSSEKQDRLLRDFSKDRRLLAETASIYRGFLDFAGLGQGVAEKRIVRCLRWQNFLLRLFANRTLGRHRDSLLTCPATRALGALVTPRKTFLPALFAPILAEKKNPFSDRFLEEALASMQRRLCGRGG